MCFNTLPNSYTLDLVVDQVHILYAIIKGWSIDVGSLISKWLTNMVTSRKNILIAYPSLITTLCLHGGMETSAFLAKP